MVATANRVTLRSVVGLAMLLHASAGLGEQLWIELASQAVKITWDSDFGKGYRVLRSLSPGDAWEPLGNLKPGTGAEMYLYEDIQNIRKRFYRLEVTDITPPGMVPIPGGMYEMGDHFGIEGSCYGPFPVYSLPVHTVCVDSFYMDATEVTNADFCAFVNASMRVGEVNIGPKGMISTTGHRPVLYCLIRFVDATGREFIGSDLRYDEPSGALEIVPGREEHPAIEAGWHGAAAYCNWRSQQQGIKPCYDPETWECNFDADGYRLPTEAEWEYAARGELRYSIYPWGDEIDGSKANYWGSGDPHDDDWIMGIGVPTTPVASYAPNAYGLYDIAGNALELCNDLFQNTYYQYCVENGIIDNPTGPPARHDHVHVRRGGSCFNDAICLSCSMRYPDEYVPILSGFRCVRRSNLP